MLGWAKNLASPACIAVCIRVYPAVSKLAPNVALPNRTFL